MVYLLYGVLIHEPATSIASWEDHQELLVEEYMSMG